MRCRILLIAAMLLQPAWPQNGRAQPASPLAQCAIAIATAERAETLPPGLLGAIGRVESGRYDPVTGSLQPWPWTIDADGIGRQFETKDAAIEAVRGLRAEGVRSIDVGCMQVNLQQHPQAFATLEQALDPAANAAYAAHFLRVLFAESLDWSTAAGAYHSHTPDIGAPYRQLVLETWGMGAILPIAWSGPKRAVPLLPTAPRPPLRPFAPPLLAGPGAEPLAHPVAARLLALTPDCTEAAPPAYSSWVTSARAPTCGRSPFASSSLLRQLLASQ